MKIDEAVDRIKSTSKSIVAWKNKGYIHVAFNTFTVLVIPYDAKTFFDVNFINQNIKPPVDVKAQLAGIIGKFLRTPIKQRFPEKKYRLRWIDDEQGRVNYMNIDDGGVWGFNAMGLGPTEFTESALELLKRDNPRLAPAIDAMKEEVKEDEN